MAKIRRRFYVAAINGGGYEILSLKFRPSPEVYSYSHTLVDGPFRTFDLAVKALENRVGCKSYPCEVINHATRQLERVGFTRSEAERIIKAVI